MDVYNAKHMYLSNTYSLKLGALEAVQTLWLAYFHGYLFTTEYFCSLSFTVIDRTLLDRGLSAWLSHGLVPAIANKTQVTQQIRILCTTEAEKERELELRKKERFNTNKRSKK